MRAAIKQLKTTKRSKLNLRIWCKQQTFTKNISNKVHFEEQYRHLNYDGPLKQPNLQNPKNLLHSQKLFHSGLKNIKSNLFQFEFKRSQQIQDEPLEILLKIKACVVK